MRFDIIFFLNFYFLLSEPQFWLWLNGCSCHGAIGQKMANSTRTTQVRGVSTTHGQVSQ